MGKVVLTLLVAGDSRRFNGNKLLHLFDRKPTYQYLVDEIEKSPETLFEKKTVVTQYQEIMSVLGEKGYLVVENCENGLGISHSIELGVRVAEAWGDYGLCFAVCDQPCLRGETVRTLVDEFLRSGKSTGCLSCQEELDNLAMFPNRHRGELLALEGDVDDRRVTGHHPDDLFLCEVKDGGELMGVDMKKGRQSSHEI